MNIWLPPLVTSSFSASRAWTFTHFGTAAKVFASPVGAPAPSSSRISLSASLKIKEWRAEVLVVRMSLSAS